MLKVNKNVRFAEKRVDYLFGYLQKMVVLLFVANNKNHFSHSDGRTLASYREVLGLIPNCVMPKTV